MGKVNDAEMKKKILNYQQRQFCELQTINVSNNHRRLQRCIKFSIETFSVLLEYSINSQATVH